MADGIPAPKPASCCSTAPPPGLEGCSAAAAEAELDAGACACACAWPAPDWASLEASPEVDWPFLAPAPVAFFRLFRNSSNFRRPAEARSSFVLTVGKDPSFATAADALCISLAICARHMRHALGSALPGAKDEHEEEVRLVVRNPPGLSQGARGTGASWVKNGAEKTGPTRRARTTGRSLQM